MRMKTKKGTTKMALKRKAKGERKEGKIKNINRFAKWSKFWLMRVNHLGDL